MWREEQKKEIETIKERTVTLRLSDADCKRIARKAGMANLTVGELLENFIGDLVGGTYTNGSDECDCADAWYDRCGFGMFPEETLLRYLLEYNYDVDDFFTAYDELEFYKEKPEEFEDQVAEAKENGETMLWFEEEYHDYIDDFLQEHPDCDLKKEIELCRKWLADSEKMIGC